MGFLGKNVGGGLPFFSSEGSLDPGIEPASLTSPPLAGGSSPLVRPRKPPVYSCLPMSLPPYPSLDSGLRVGSLLLLPHKAESSNGQ